MSNPIDRNCAEAWCTNHQGEAESAHGFQSDDEVGESKYLGRHSTSFHDYRRFENDIEPYAVRVRQSFTTLGVDEPEINLWANSRHRSDPIDEIPRSHRITAVEARALGEALIRAADMVAGILPNRCSECGEPVAFPGACSLCFMRANALRAAARRAEGRSRLKAVN